MHQHHRSFLPNKQNDASLSVGCNETVSRGHDQIILCTPNERDHGDIKSTMSNENQVTWVGGIIFKHEFKTLKNDRMMRYDSSVTSQTKILSTGLVTGNN